jgi:hypothetical protein
VAVETSAVDRETGAEKVWILAELGKQDMDLLVGCWIDGIIQEMKKESEEENKEVKETMKEQRPRDVAEGKIAFSILKNWTGKSSKKKKKKKKKIHTATTKCP